jgi:hypothetical protein
MAAGGGDCSMRDLPLKRSAMCRPENASRIKDARSQIVCSVVDLLPFCDAGWRRLIRIMFLRFNKRWKGSYWNIVENKRCAGGKVVQRQVSSGRAPGANFAWHFSL